MVPPEAAMQTDAPRVPGVAVEAAHQLQDLQLAHKEGRFARTINKWASSDAVAIGIAVTAMSAMRRMRNYESVTRRKA